MWVKFIKDWHVFKVGELGDVTRSKAAELRSSGHIEDGHVTIIEEAPEAPVERKFKKSGRPRK